ncbi:MAG TPA: prepilin-type N-terminal cleavage/methylation domain-containing protein [Candidatus Methylomirabilis sp.]|jgi:prepilin-type N-terminal cleavage/methylation domain-containing protein|nr:prepilin-type N-terminal cleavage/methylation domain-containing protein [Candidatus Methylomirabilis sp.]
MLPSRPRPPRGFTLLETLLATAIVAVVLGAIYTMYLANQETFLKGEARSDLQQSARIAMDEMLRTLRDLGYDPRVTGRFGFRDAANPGTGGSCPGGSVGCATEAEIRFTLDDDGDGLLDDAGTERLGFRLRDGVLQKIKPGAVLNPQPLATGITILRFTFLDAAGQRIPDPPGATYTLTPAQRDAVRRVRIELTASRDVQGKTQAFSLTSEALLRNPLP